MAPFYQTPKRFYEDGLYADIGGLHLLSVRSLLPFCLFLLLLRCGNDALAQQPVMQHWSQAEGLASKVVFGIVQDHKGHIWLGHDKGLSRFDGRSVVHYAHPAMNGGGVSNLIEDAKGRIRCQSFIGQMFVMEADSMVLVEHIPASGNYSPIVQGNDGTLISAVGRKITVLDADLRKKDSAEAPHGVYTMQHQADGLWVMDETGLTHMVGGKVMSTYSLGNSAPPAHYLLAKLKGRMLAIPKTAGKGLVYQMLPEFGVFKLLPANAVIQAAEVFADSLLMVGTTDGLYLFDGQLKLLPMQQPLLRGHNISGVMQDRDGAFWILTIDNGVYRIPNLGIMAYAQTEDVFSVFAHRNDGDALLIGTESGSVWQLGNAFAPLYVSEARHRVSSMLRHNGHTLAASDKLYLHYPDGHTHTLSMAVKDMLAIDDRHVVLAISSALKLIDLNEKNPRMTELPIGVENFRSNALSIAPNGATLQLATTVGIWQLQTSPPYKAELLNAEVIANRLLWVGDTLLAATIDRGIVMLRNGKVVGSIVVEGSAKQQTVLRMIHHRGSVYAKFNDHIYSISTKNWKPERINTSFLGSSDVVNDFVVKGDRLFLATEFRIIALPLATQQRPATVPSIFIDHVRGRDMELDPASDMRLPCDRNSLQIDYSIPWYGDQRGLAVQFRLNDAPWQTNEPLSRMLNLPYLSPGSYTVQLRAQLPDGRFTPVAEVKITIVPPLYARWWFRLLSALLIGGALYALYRYRLRFIERQNVLLQQKIKLEQELDRSMLASIRSQMNPHFIFNALNTIQSYIYLNDKPNAISYLGKFSSLTRLILDMSSHERVSLRDEIDALKLYLELEKVRFEESLEVKMEVDKAIHPDQCFIPPMLIQPYVENAVKHGLLHKKAERELRIAFRLNKEFLEVTIEDNGIGRKRSAELNAKSTRHRPFATEANQKRLEIMNKAIPEGFTVTYIDRVDAQGRAEGTTVVLLMPLK